MNEPRDLLAELEIAKTKNEPRDLLAELNNAQQKNQAADLSPQGMARLQQQAAETGATSPLMQGALSLGLGATQGISDIPIGIGNLALMGIKGAGKLIGHEPNIPYMKRWKIDEQAHYPGAAFAGELLPSLLIPGGMAARAGSAAGRLAASAGTGAGWGAVSGALNPEENNVLMSTLLGGGIGAAAHGALGIAPTLKNKFFKSWEKNASPGSLRSPEQVGEMMESLKGLPVDIGSIVNAPGTSSFYNSILREIPGAGISGKQEKLLSERNKLANDIIPENQRKQSSENFKNLFKKADEQGKIIQNFENYSNAAKDILKETEGLAPKAAEEVAKEHNLFDFINKNKTEGFKNGGQYFSPDVIEKNPLLKNMMEKEDLKEKGRSFQEVHHLQSYLGNSIRKAKREGDYNKLRLYHQLDNAITNDVENAFKDSPELLKELKQHRNFHAKNVIAPEEFEDLKKSLEHEEYFNTPTLLNRIQKIKNTDERQFNTLFSPKQQKDINKLNTIQSVIGEAALANKKPASGYRNYEQLIKGLALGGLASGAYFHPLASAPFLGLAGLSNILGRYFRSPKLIQQYVNRNPTLFGIGKQGRSTIANSLAGLGGKMAGGGMEELMQLLSGNGGNQ